MTGGFLPDFSRVWAKNPIFSNPVSFFPIAEGVVINVGTAPINVTISATGPILGNYTIKPADITIIDLQPQATESIQLTAGYTY